MPDLPSKGHAPRDTDGLDYDEAPPWHWSPQRQPSLDDTLTRLKRSLGRRVLAELAAAGLTVTLRDGALYRAGGDEAAAARAEKYRAEILLALEGNACRDG